MKKYISLTLALIVIAALLVGCTKGDKVLKAGQDSFAGIIKAYPVIIKDNTKEDYISLSVDGVTSLKISRDYSLTDEEDILIETPLKPFIDAGLDVSKLTDGYKAQDEKLYLIGDYGNGTGTKETAQDSLFESAAYDRTMLTYHRDLDYCGISTRGNEKDSFVSRILNKIFGDTAMLSDPNGLDRFGIRISKSKFEYAKNYAKNDKDIVFMIEAKPLVAFGVDVHHVDGWIFTTMEDLDCNDTDVLLKTYDLQ